MTCMLDVKKAIQAVGVLLRREGKRASRLRLLKLLYIADRISLQRTGRQILGSKIVAMKHGPLHSEVFNLIEGDHVQTPLWSHYFRNSGRDVVLEEEPGTDALSRQDIDLMNSVVDSHATLDDWGVADETHEFQEWKTAYPDPSEDKSRPIPFELLIESVGRKAEADAILQDIKDSEAFDRLFSGAR